MENSTFSSPFQQPTKGNNLKYFRNSSYDTLGPPYLTNKQDSQSKVKVFCYQQWRSNYQGWKSKPFETKGGLMKQKKNYTDEHADSQGF